MFVALRTWAQVTTGQIDGYVFDPSHRPVPHAEVVARHTERGARLATACQLPAPCGRHARTGQGAEADSIRSAHIILGDVAHAPTRAASTLMSMPGHV